LDRLLREKYATFRSLVWVQPYRNNMSTATTTKISWFANKC